MAWARLQERFSIKCLLHSASVCSKGAEINSKWSGPIHKSRCGFLAIELQSLQALTYHFPCGKWATLQATGGVKLAYLFCANTLCSNKTVCYCRVCRGFDDADGKREFLFALPRFARDEVNHFSFAY